MSINKTNIIIIAIVILSFIAGFSVYDKLPDKMACHWNANGQVDGYMQKLWGVLSMPLVMVVIAFILTFIIRIDPLKANIEKFIKYYNGFIIVILVFLLVVHLQIILWNLGTQISPNITMPIGIGFLFLYIGYLCENSKRNWFIGIRTPWTLSSDEVWEKTNKIGGILLKLAGVIIMLGVFFHKYAIYFVLIPIAPLIISTALYSYFAYRKCGSKIGKGFDKKDSLNTTPQNQMWNDLKSEYIQKVHKALSATDNPRQKEVLDDISSHLDRRFAELQPDQQNWENFQAIITQMGPPADYAELLAPQAAASNHNINIKSLLWILIFPFIVIAAVILLHMEPTKVEPVTKDEFLKSFPQKIEQFNIDKANYAEVIKTFGEPLDYVWGNQNFTKKNLPLRYIMVYPVDFRVFMSEGQIVEVRYEGPGANYAFLGKIKIDSPLQEVLDVVGQPTETVTGEKLNFAEGVLYKDIDGRKGYCYYHRPDHHVRFFFLNYKVKAIYVTRSDYND